MPPAYWHVGRQSPRQRILDRDFPDAGRAYDDLIAELADELSRQPGSRASSVIAHSAMCVSNSSPIYSAPMKISYLSIFGIDAIRHHKHSLRDPNPLPFCRANRDQSGDRPSVLRDDHLAFGASFNGLDKLGQVCLGIEHVDYWHAESPRLANTG